MDLTHLNSPSRSSVSSREPVRLLRRRSCVPADGFHAADFTRQLRKLEQTTGLRSNALLMAMASPPAPPRQRHGSKLKGDPQSLLPRPGKKANGGRHSDNDLSAAGATSSHPLRRSFRGPPPPSPLQECPLSSTVMANFDEQQQNRAARSSRRHDAVGSDDGESPGDHAIPLSAWPETSDWRNSSGNVENHHHNHHDNSASSFGARKQRIFGRGNEASPPGGQSPAAPTTTGSTAASRADGGEAGAVVAESAAHSPLGAAAGRNGCGDEESEGGNGAAVRGSQPPVVGGLGLGRMLSAVSCDFRNFHSTEDLLAGRRVQEDAFEEEDDDDDDEEEVGEEVWNARGSQDFLPKDASSFVTTSSVLNVHAAGGASADPAVARGSRSRSTLHLLRSPSDAGVSRAGAAGTASSSIRSSGASLASSAAAAAEKVPGSGGGRGRGAYVGGGVEEDEEIAALRAEYLVIQKAMAVRKHIDAYSAKDSLFEFCEHLSLCLCLLFEAPLVLVLIHDRESDELVGFHPSDGTWLDMLESFNIRRSSSTVPTSPPLQHHHYRHQQDDDASSTSTNQFHASTSAHPSGATARQNNPASATHQPRPSSAIPRHPPTANGGSPLSNNSTAVSSLGGGGSTRSSVGFQKRGSSGSAYHREAQDVLRFSAKRGFLGNLFRGAAGPASPVDFVLGPEDRASQLESTLRGGSRNGGARRQEAPPDDLLTSFLRQKIGHLFGHLMKPVSPPVNRADGSTTSSSETSAGGTGVGGQHPSSPCNSHRRTASGDLHHKVTPHRATSTTTEHHLHLVADTNRKLSEGDDDSSHSFVVNFASVAAGAQPDEDSVAPLTPSGAARLLAGPFSSTAATSGSASKFLFERVPVLACPLLDPSIARPTARRLSVPPPPPPAMPVTRSTPAVYDYHHTSSVAEPQHYTNSGSHQRLTTPQAAEAQVVTAPQTCSSKRLSNAAPASPLSLPADSLAAAEPRSSDGSPSNAAPAKHHHAGRWRNSAHQLRPSARSSVTSHADSHSTAAATGGYSTHLGNRMHHLEAPALEEHPPLGMIVVFDTQSILQMALASAGGVASAISPAVIERQQRAKQSLLVTVAAEVEGSLKRIGSLESARRERDRSNILLKFHRQVCKDLSDPERTIMRLVQLVVSAMRVEHAALYVADIAAKEFICFIGHPNCHDLRLPLNHPLLSPAFFRRSIHMAAHDDVPRQNQKYDRLSGMITRASVAMPLISAEGVVHGVLHLMNRLEPTVGATEVPSTSGAPVSVPSPAPGAKHQNASASVFRGSNQPDIQTTDLHEDGGQQQNPMSLITPSRRASANVGLMSGVDDAPGYQQHRRPSALSQGVINYDNFPPSAAGTGSAELRPTVVPIQLRLTDDNRTKPSLAPQGTFAKLSVVYEAPSTDWEPQESFTKEDEVILKALSDELTRTFSGQLAGLCMKFISQSRHDSILHYVFPEAVPVDPPTSTAAITSPSPLVSCSHRLQGSVTVDNLAPHHRQLYSDHETHDRDAEECGLLAESCGAYFDEIESNSKLLTSFDNASVALAAARTRSKSVPANPSSLVGHRIFAGTAGGDATSANDSSAPEGSSLWLHHQQPPTGRAGAEHPATAASAPFAVGGAVEVDKAVHQQPAVTAKDSDSGRGHLRHHSPPGCGSKGQLLPSVDERSSSTRHEQMTRREESSEIFDNGQLRDDGSRMQEVPEAASGKGGTRGEVGVPVEDGELNDEGSLVPTILGRSESLRAPPLPGMPLTEAEHFDNGPGVASGKFRLVLPGAIGNLKGAKWLRARAAAMSGKQKASRRRHSLGLVKGGSWRSGSGRRIVDYPQVPLRGEDEFGGESPVAAGAATCTATMSAFNFRFMNAGAAGMGAPSSPGAVAICKEPDSPMTAAHLQTMSSATIIDSDVGPFSAAATKAVAGEDFFSLRVVSPTTRSGTTASVAGPGKHRRAGAPASSVQFIDLFAENKATTGYLALLRRRAGTRRGMGARSMTSAANLDAAAHAMFPSPQTSGGQFFRGRTAATLDIRKAPSLSEIAETLLRTPDQQEVRAAPRDSWEIAAELERKWCVWNTDWWTVPGGEMLNFFLDSLGVMGLLDTLHISKSAMTLFFKLVRSGYHTDNPYHNFFHAMQVYQVSFMLLWQHDLAQWLHVAERLGLLVGAIAHDVDHPGVSNSFFIRNQHSKSLIYNDHSVLEHHHAAYVFQILMVAPEADFRKSMTTEEQTLFRKSIITAILATDMAYHSAKLAAFSDRAQKHATHIEPWSIEKESDRELLVGMTLHAADLSNQLMKYPYFRHWGSLICEEFCRQCDLEAAVGLEVTAFMNVRTELAKAQLQVGFSEFVVLPCWRSMLMLAPSLKDVLERGKRNTAFWHVCLEQIKKENPTPPATKTDAAEGGPKEPSARPDKSDEKEEESSSQEEHNNDDEFEDAAEEANKMSTTRCGANVEKEDEQADFVDIDDLDSEPEGGEEGEETTTSSKSREDKCLRVFKARAHKCIKIDGTLFTMSHSQIQFPFEEWTTTT